MELLFEQGEISAIIYSGMRMGGERFVIIWGTYVTKKELSAGQFYCPNCKSKKAYSLRRPRKWGHLYWIPIIPMEDFDPYVECSGCSKTYNEVVLQHDPEKDAQELDRQLSVLITHALAMTASANGERPSVEYIADWIAKLIGVQPSLDEIRRTMLANDREAALQHIKTYSPGLTSKGKEMVLLAAVGNRKLSEDTLYVAKQLGTSLGMTDAHVRGVLAEV